MIDLKQVRGEAQKAAERVQHQALDVVEFFSKEMDLHMEKAAGDARFWQESWARGVDQAMELGGALTRELYGPVGRLFKGSAREQGRATEDKV